MKQIFGLLWLTAIVAACQGVHPSVTLSWTWTQGAGAPATSFNVKRGTQPGGPYGVVISVTPTATTYLDQGSVTNPLPDGQQFCYIVTAVGTGGESGPSPETCNRIPFSTPPSAPTNLSGTVR